MVKTKRKQKPAVKNPFLSFSSSVEIVLSYKIFNHMERYKFIFQEGVKMAEE